VVLGGGGAKAAAHLGAAVALADAGVTPVHWGGTSRGAVIAVAMAGGADPAALLASFGRLRARDVLQRVPFFVARGIWSPSILRGQVFRRAIERLITPRRFADLRVPCTVTAVEADTGRSVAFGTDGEDAPILDVLAASCALPPWFPAVTVNGRRFYDGGLRAPMPLGLAERLDVDLVIAIDVGPGFDELGAPVHRPPPLVASADTAVGWLMAGTTALLRAQWNLQPTLPPLLWVRPVNDRGATFALDRVAEYGRAGERAMRTALQEL
jgi:NTE family protein